MREEFLVEARIRSEVREYIVVTWLSGDSRGLDDHTDLQQAGILDSFSTMALIAHLEQSFRVQLEPADVTAETFRSLDSIARLISIGFPGHQTRSDSASHHQRGNTMEQKLRSIVARIAETSPDFDANARLRDALGVDSVRSLEIVFEIEKELGLAVPEDCYAEVKTLNDIIQLVSSLKV